MHINVTINGTTGSGKSTISNIIYNALNDMGFDADVTLLDSYIPSKDVIEQRIESCLDRDIKIHIIEQQTLRPSAKRILTRNCNCCHPTIQYI